MSKFDGVITAAANWWADRLTQIGMQDNGDADQSMLASYVALKIAETHGAMQPHERERFVATLAPALHQELSRWERVYLRVDYGPCALLHGALAAAIPDPGRLRHFDSFWPIKTSMRVTADQVEAARGYGAPYVQVYPKGA